MEKRIKRAVKQGAERRRNNVQGVVLLEIACSCDLETQNAYTTTVIDDDARAVNR